MKLLKTLSTSLFIIALSGGYVTATEPLNNTEVVKKADIKNFAAHSNLVYSAAQPSKEQLKQLSKADVNSSNIKIFGFLYNARAIAILCF